MRAAFPSLSTLLLLPLLLPAGCARQEGAPAATAKPAGETPAPAARPGWEEPLQGRWTVVSSSGKPDSGHVFFDKLGQEITIHGDLLTTTELDLPSTKKIIPRADVGPRAFDLEPEEPRWKTWSRVAILEVEGERLTLCVNFPQGPRPTRFQAAEDGRECVVMRRLVASLDAGPSGVRPPADGSL